MRSGTRDKRLSVSWKRRLVSYLANLLWRISLPFLPWFFSEAHFEGLYRKREDPWNYTQSPYEKEKYQKTLEAVPEDTHFILEVGTSEGVFTELLLQRGKHVTGIDISQTALERAWKRLKKYGNRVTLRKLDIVRDEPEGVFDLILASEVLYYLGGRGILLSLEEKFFRHLRPEGYLLLVHFYPSGKIIHDLFLERGRFVRVLEEIVYHPERDYIITLLQKIEVPTSP
ncbi:MAG: class I SAM-dependent methyltransferase [Candidatus Caldatribacterium sp.]|nr:class I SAM-dependent methyltransferase [Candidatus Caldatribacterium sp.]